MHHQQKKQEQKQATETGRQQQQHAEKDVEQQQHAEKELEQQQNTDDNNLEQEGPSMQLLDHTDHNQESTGVYCYPTTGQTPISSKSFNAIRKRPTSARGR